MKEMITDFWSLALPDEWKAEQEDETVIVIDADQISVIELTVLTPDSGMTLDDLIDSISSNEYVGDRLAELPCLYGHFEDEGAFYREWLIPLENEKLLVISHGCDLEDKGLDDSAVDEILSTLLVGEGDEE
ncbi:MAG: hypothetical protein OXE99_13200 [Cellvibrionales bacterium]|nr:hypothetical protein [Cellvibrionales bacterium]